MKEIVADPGTHITQELATWYRALTLAERITTSTTTLPHQQVPTLSPDDVLGRKRLQRWKEQLAFKQEGDFTARLAHDGLTEETLLALLAEPPEALQAHISTVPAWLEELLCAFAEPRDDTDFVLPLPPHGFDPHHLAFITMLKPLLKKSVISLQATIHRLSTEYTHLPFDPDSVLTLLLISLIERLLSSFIRTAVLELNVARVEGRLEGNTPEERFHDFIRQVVQHNGIPPLLEEYAVLTRLLVEHIARWEVRETELLERLCSDWEQIGSTFTPDHHPGQLIALHEGAGDTHRDGRSVTILSWDSGFRLVYKPHTLAIDAHFQELLTWLNERGQQPPLHTFAILDKESYGWAEFLHAVPCSSREEVERFYQRQGSYLALLYALAAVDFHSENVIAMGEHPMLVDLESLFHPRIDVPAKDKSESPAFETIGRSVQRIGLLPERIWGIGDAEGVDISGLGGQRGQLTPEPLPRWTAIGTDQMHLKSERAPLDPGRNRPTLDGQDINTLDYSEYVNTGFSYTYRLLMQLRKELLVEILPRFAHDEIRCLLRPTRVYGMLLKDAFHPNLLRDALDRDCLFDRLWLGTEHQPHLRKVIRAEQAALWWGDIPMFSTYANAHDLCTCDGEVVEAFFVASGIELATKRIQQLDEEDLECQNWIIHASFTSMILGTDEAVHKTLHLQPSTRVVTRAQLLAAAQAVGDRLSKLALANEETVGWLGVNVVKEREWHLMAAEEDLYGGASGIVLFLAYLGALTGEERYTTLAHAALPAIRHFVTRKKKLPHLGGIGLFVGAGSYIYLLSHLGALWHEPALYKEAEELVELLPGAIAMERSFDVIGGAAGCIAALNSLFAVAPSDSLFTRAVLCGDHLLACARPMEKGSGWSAKSENPPLAGLAHGAAGIALNLLRLFKLSKEPRFQRGALAAIEYERSLFSPEAQNWPDLRPDNPANQAQTSSEAAQRYMVAWCHGASGIGLARLGGLPMLDTPEIRMEIDVAIRTTLKEGLGMNHSLCHGDLGNMDLLLTAARMLDNAKYQPSIDRIGAMLLDSIDRQGWVTGVPLGVETPGLMTGLAGIGHGLLRLAAPDEVPSVLLGEVPASKK